MADALRIGGLAALFVMSTAQPAQAMDYPKKAFDATFVSTGTGASTMHMISDGKGHVRNEVEAGNYQTVSIFDYPGKVNLVIRPAAKRVMRMQLKDGQEDVYDEASIKRHNPKSLGSKVLDGHPCKGWVYTAETGGQVEIWLADDIQLAVKTVVTTKSGKVLRTSVLKSYSPATPPASAFAIPAGYSITEISSTPPR